MGMTIPMGLLHDGMRYTPLIPLCRQSVSSACGFMPSSSPSTATSWICRKLASPMKLG